MRKKSKIALEDLNERLERLQDDSLGTEAHLRPGKRALAKAKTTDDIQRVSALFHPHCFPNGPAATPLSFKDAPEAWSSMFFVHKLPTELLIRTIHYSDFQPSPLHSPYHNELADFGSSSLLQLAVERSRSFPLVITTGHLKMDVMKFIRAVTPHVRRCRVLCFTPPPSVWNGTEDNEARAAAYNLLSQPCPALKELYLSGLPKSILSRSHQSRMPEVWALENVAKNLKVLSLASMDWYSTPVLSSLQELKLCSVQTSVSTLMTKCLNSASNLRVLDLKDLRLDQDRQDPPLSGPISLDFLQNITISDSSTTEMAQILPHIVTPVLRRLILKAKSSDDSPPFGSNPYYHRLIRSIAATAKGPIQVYVSHNRHSFAMFDTYNDSEVSIEWRGLTSMEAKLNFVKWLADTCNSFSSVASIHLILVNIRLIRDLLVPLTSIHNVTKLQIGEDAVDLRELYRRLSYPILSKGTKDWLFPRMSVLEFTSKDAISGMIDLVQMLKTRCDVGREDEGREGESHGDEGTQPEPPTIFKEC
ncbi:hypothetical protein FRB90_012156 [Tulasnella sp. 427]|nr:hypothetical protein FRB90_012156 [Tulasnella sp. 427]